MDNLIKLFEDGHFEKAARIVMSLRESSLLISKLNYYKRRRDQVFLNDREYLEAIEPLVKNLLDEILNSI